MKLFRFFLFICDFRCFFGDGPGEQGGQEESGGFGGGGSPDGGDGNGDNDNNSSLSDSPEEAAQSDVDSTGLDIDGYGYGYDSDTGLSYGWSTDSSFSYGLDDLGNVTSAYGSINAAVDGYSLGVSSSFSDSFFGSSISSTGYTQEMGLFGMATVAVEFDSYQNIGSFALNTSLANSVSINGINVGLLGKIGYHTLGIEAAQIGYGISFGLSMFSSFQGLQVGLAMLDLGLKAPATVSMLTSLKSMYSSIDAARSLYGASTSLNVSTLANNSSGGELTLIKSVNNAIREDEEQRINSNQFISSMMDLSIFDYLAGGHLFDIEFAGSDLYSADKLAAVPETQKLNISNSTKLMHLGFQDQTNKNLAGSKNFNILNI